MPLTPEQVAAIQAEIELGATLAGPFVQLFGPQATAGLLIGRAVANQVPELVAIVQRWVEGQAPTEEEKAKLKEQLAVLGDPNLP